MRTAFFVWEYPPKLVGGLGTFSQYVCPKMVKLSVDVSVFTMNDKKGTLKTREVSNGVEIHRPLNVNIVDTLPLIISEDLKRWGDRVQFFAAMHSYNILCASKLINDLIEKEGHDFHIIHANDWLSAEAGIIVKRHTGLPFIFHMHSAEQGRTMGNGSETIIHLEKTAADKADRVITVSYAMQEELTKYGIPLEKISVCWNGVDVEKYNSKNLKGEDIQRLRSRYGIGPEEKMILFVGRLVPEKGIIQLVMAMPMIIKKHPEAKLVILGCGSVGMQRQIMDLVKIHNLENNVKTRFEWVTEKERILHYGACDLAVLPSRYEPFGIVCTEAMAMERAVVVGTFGTSGFRDQVIPSGPEQTGFHVNSNNPADIAQWGVIPALDDPEATEEMAKRGRQRVKELFTWDKSVRSILRVYNEVIETKSK